MTWGLFFLTQGVQLLSVEISFKAKFPVPTSGAICEKTQGAFAPQGARVNLHPRRSRSRLGTFLLGYESHTCFPLYIAFPLNPRPDRGGWCNHPPPLRFFADSEKTAARSAAGFWGTLWGKPCATFGKKKLTRSGQVTEL